jgi:hypothetical protein
MKVLITVFEICDYGGIVAGVENLIKGFRLHGHDVDLVLLRPNDRNPTLRKAEGPDNCWTSETGGFAHTLNGWYGILVMSYGTPVRLRQWQDHASGYDLVIHEIPNPEPIEGWQEIFNIAPPQVMVVHDAHFREMYPHIVEIAPKLAGVTCTNHAGYRALEWFPAPRAFIGASHIPANWLAQPPWELRGNQAISAHVWKAWKHMDAVVRASLHMTSSYLVLGGDGIEGRYMRSRDKCKPKYEGLWKQFKETQHTYIGLVSHEVLLEYYAASRVMVDMSYSRKFAQLGNHFNRSILEAANYGCVSICTTENMAASNEQVVLWEDGKTHIGVPQDITAESLAEVIDWATHLSPQDVEAMLYRVKAILLKHFDYRKSPEEFIKLSRGEPAGIYPKLEVGAWPTPVKVAASA